MPSRSARCRPAGETSTGPHLLRLSFGSAPPLSLHVLAGFLRASTRTIRARYIPEIHDTASKDFSHSCHEMFDVHCGLVISHETASDVSPRPSAGMRQLIAEIPADASNRIYASQEDPDRSA